MSTEATYLRILRDRLEEAGVDNETVERTIAREKATISGLSDEDVNALFTEQRLQVLITSAKKRSFAKTASDATTNTLISSTNVPQGTLTDTATIVVKETETLIPFTPNEEATVVSASPASRIPPHLLESDTATVVISSGTSYRTSPTVPSYDEAKTVVEDGTLGKILSESETVRISEKETVEFLVPEEEKTVIPSFVTIVEPSERESGLSSSDEAATMPILPPVTPVSDSDSEDILPFINNAHHEKKNTQQERISSIPIDESDLKNTRPILLFWMLFVVLFPLVLVLSFSSLALWSVVLILSLILFSLPILLYTVTVSGLGGAILYVGYSIVTNWINGNTEYLVIHFAVLFFALALLTVVILYLHRLVIPLYYFFKKRCFSFCRKSVAFFKKTLRFIFKSIRHA